MKERFSSEFFQARLGCLKAALEKGLDLDNPDQQAPLWMRIGVKLLEKGIKITPTLLDDIDKSGGTDHPDPYFG
jgi:hypothetical protein